MIGSRMEDDPCARRRARWIRVLLLSGGALLAVHACERAGAEERAFSVQMHLHGSFSEGMGSIDSHSHEAADVGCDVLWWSDHDFRITTFEHVTRFGFEDWTEPLDRGEAWSVRLAEQLSETKGLIVPARPDGSSAELVSAPHTEGERSLRATHASRKREFEPFMLAFTAARMLERRSLALGVVLRIAVFPEELGPDARGAIQVRLSEHAPREGLPETQYLLRYVLCDSAAEPFRQGDTFHVPVLCEPGRWNELALDVSADAERGFPFAPGADDALYRIALGVESRNQARASVCFDDLRIEQRISGPAGFERQRAVLAEVGAHHPGIEQLQGVEVSYGSRHLNLFGLETPLPDYAALARGMPPDPDHPELIDARAFAARVIEDTVERAHALGGLVSLNHMFGANLEGHVPKRTKEELLEFLLKDRACGADILEVGYRDRAGASLADHLWVWDHAALAGLRLIGTGVSDSHGGPEERWRGRPNNFVSWIWARSSSKADLLEGLRAGRVFFGDLERFDGTLDLVTAAGERMGQTVVTDRAEVELEIRVQDLTLAASLVVIESGMEAAIQPVQAGSFSVMHTLALPGANPAFLRVELRDPSGAFALTNPIHFLRETSAGARDVNGER